MVISEETGERRKLVSNEWSYANRNRKAQPQTTVFGAWSHPLAPLKMFVVVFQEMWFGGRPQVHQKEIQGDDYDD